MKSFFYIVISVLMALVMVSGSALAMDFSGYTDEELIALNVELVAEFVARGIGKTATIVPGEYLVGRDIPAGKYVVVNDTEGSANYLIYKDNLQNYKINEAIDGGLIDAGKEAFMVLEEGNVLKTSYQSLKITISVGVVFE